MCVELQDVYLAGLWRDDLAMGLAWYRDPGLGRYQTSYPHRDELAVSPKSSYRAPSWSWAALDVPICYLTMPEEEGLMQAFDLLESHTSLSGLDPYGQLSAGHLKLSAPFRTLRLRPADHRAGSEPFYGPTKGFATFWPDHQHSWSAVITAPCILLATSPAMSHFTGLALEEVADCPPSYRRQGCIWGGMRRTHMGSTGHRMLTRELESWLETKKREMILI